MHDVGVYKGKHNILHDNISASIYATNIKNGCQVAKKPVVDPLMKQRIFSNFGPEMISLIQCAYVGGEESL